MTAKRFTLTNPKNAFQEMKCGIDDKGNTLTFNEVVGLLNAFNEENEQLLSDKEHLMGYLIQFRSFDDDDLDYVMNRESNREYGKQYYEMKEETKKELGE